ncbi:olfactory receptor 4D1-like [Pangshura tecta]
MEKNHLSSPVTEFVLLGLTQSPELQQFLYVAFFMIHVNIWLGNLIIIITVISDHRVRTPMYFLLANLAFLDLSNSSVNTPKLPSGLHSRENIISFNECILQMFFINFMAGAMGICLVGKAIYRYVAIYKPLRYLTIMNQRACTRIMVLAWMGALGHFAVQIGLLLQLPFCGLKILDNFYCDVPQVIKLACTDTQLVELQMVFNSVSVIYTAITPMPNPMIYTLRNTEMKKAIRRLMSRMLCSGRETET